MLTATASASPPPARIPATVVSSEPASGWSPSRSVRAAQITRPPSIANSRAISAPMPRLAPVTTTTFPSSWPIPPSSARVLGGGRHDQAVDRARAAAGLEDHQRVDVDLPHHIAEVVAQLGEAQQDIDERFQVGRPRPAKALE